MKIILLLIIAILVPSVYALEDNFYFTIPPGEEKCLNFDVPRDFHTFSEGRYRMNLTSDFPVNLNFIETDASNKNRIDIPICFSAEGRDESDFGDYSFLLTSEGRSRTLKGGICVSSIDDVDIVNKEGDACDLINGQNDLFATGLSPETVYTKPGREAKIVLKLLSSEDIQIEVRPETDLIIDKSPRIIDLERGKREYMDFNFTAPERGSYNFSVDVIAIINRQYCKFPFCQTRLTNKVFVDGVTKTGWDFNVFPISFQTSRLEPTDFTVTVTNFDKEREFNVETELPEGLKTNFEQTSFTLNKNEQTDIVVKITPQTLDERLYAINFIVRSDVEENQLAYLNVGEYTTDICRRFPQICSNKKPPALGGCKVIGTNLINTSCLFDSDGNEALPINTIPEPVKRESPPSEGINPLFIIMPFLAIILVLIYFFFKKARY